MFLKYDYDNNFILDVIFRYIESNEPSKRLKKLTRNIISSVDYAKLKRLNSIDTYVIEKLVEKTFVDADDVNEASLIFENVNNKLKNTWLSFYDLEGIMGPLIQKYPFKFLEIFIDYKGEPSWNKEHFLKKSFSEKSIFSYIDDDIIIEWIKKSEKQLEISYVLYPFIYDTDKQCFHWSKLGKYILNSYFENDSIVNNLINNMYPSSWSNEYSNVLKDRVNLFCELKNSQNPVIRDLGEKQYKEIMKKIDYFLSEERKENEKRFNSFEENIVNL